MVRKRKYGNWQPVQLTENLISKGVDGLVGIEELTDYAVVKGHDGRSIHKETGRKSNADVGFQQTSAKRKKDLRQPSSKRRKLNHKRKYQKKNVIERSTEVLKTDEDEVLKTDEDEAESTYSEAERKCEVSDFTDKMSAWSGLGIASSILRALAEQGFVEPTEIQAKTLPATLLGRRDVLGAAETGSGKTLAFGIPILHRILEDKERSTGDTKKADDAESYEDETDPEECELTDIGCAQVVSDISLHNTKGYPASKLYALVLTPTRELAMQVHRHLTCAAKYTGIKIAVVVGGMAPQKQERLLSRRPEIVVATPGRLWELIQDGNPHLAQISNISHPDHGA